MSLTPHPSAPSKSAEALLQSPALAGRAGTEPRLRRRKRLLIYSAPAVLVAAVLAVKLLSLPIVAGQAGSAFAEQNAPGTLQAGSAMGVLNVVERYKSHFALGDGHVLAGDFDRAREEFNRALELVPANESCKVRVNLVLSLEKLGEKKQQAGETASAMELFAHGSTIVSQAPRDCFTQSENNRDGEGEALKKAGERLQEKQKGASKDPGKEQDPHAEPAPDAPSGEKIDQLEKSGEQAQKERTKSQKLREDYTEPKSNPVPKPW